MTERLDPWVSATIRGEIERRFYAKINEQADLVRLVNDPEFMAAPDRHVGLFSDHGVVHARDIANQVLDVLASCHGVLIPRRDPQRFALMQGYGVLLAYFHDVGMIDFSVFGRSMHPEFVAQVVFDPLLDDLIDAIWRENSGGLAWHLLLLSDKGLLTQEPKLVLREMLSLSICHSKTKIPVAMLNDPETLRTTLIQTVTTELHALFAQQQMHKQHSDAHTPQPGTENGQLNPKIERYAHLFPYEAYCWLVDQSPALLDFVEDVIDTIRALRAADALRQRGSVLETSGHYQVFVDQHSGNSVYALRLGADRIYLLELSNAISTGEANIASSELENSGDLRISFHRGSFSGPGAQEHSARCAALVISGIQGDVIDSFRRAQRIPDLKQASEMLIRLEETEDDIAFSRRVQDELAKLDSDVANRVVLTPSLTHAHPQERKLYLAAEPLRWGMPTRRDVLARLGQTGYPVERIDEERAFDNVRALTLDAGDALIEAQSPSSFVYLPLGPGLTIIPMGGYRSFPAQPWLLLGATGVIRGRERSATIVAVREVQVLMIPKSTYLTYWHHTLSFEKFRAAMVDANAEIPSPPESITQLEKSVLLQAVPVFKTLDQQTLADVASKTREVHAAAGETIITKGSLGTDLFVVVKGSLSVYDGTLLLGRLGPGDVFGEMAAFTPELRTATVTATEDCSLLKLNQSDLKLLVSNKTEVAHGIIEVLAAYLRTRTADVKELTKQLEEQAAYRNQ